VARYDITLNLPALPGAWLDTELADRLGAALHALPSGTVRAARLVSRTQRGYQVVTRVKVDMSGTASDMATATGAAVDALTAAAADAGTWDLAGLSAETRPAPLRPAPRPARGRANPKLRAWRCRDRRWPALLRRGRRRILATSASATRSARPASSWATVDRGIHLQPAQPARAAELTCSARKLPRSSANGKGLHAEPVLTVFAGISSRKRTLPSRCRY
jgi:hypothetical protein